MTAYPLPMGCSQFYANLYKRRPSKPNPNNSGSDEVCGKITRLRGRFSNSAVIKGSNKNGEALPGRREGSCLIEAARLRHEPEWFQDDRHN